MKNDIEIAQSTKLKPIQDIAQSLGLTEDQIEPYGRFKAKINLNELPQNLQRSKNHLILVTAISPTPAGEGKTTTTIGLGDALSKIGKKTIVCLREPSLGPVFGMKGGATGGGFSQVAPMEDINLHFTGDFNAIQLANNLLAALIDNHIHHGNTLDFDVRRITWKRVLDLNDRALRDITVSLGGPANGFPRQDGFDIVVASEVMAILCLASSLQDLKLRLGNIVVGYTRNQKPITAKDLNAHGSMAVLLKDAIHPNLAQTLEHTPAIIHGGPFANIAHGCSSLIGTQTALKLADFVVTEAGFGADLGAEKFINIKCRKGDLRPSLAVIVVTVRALKYHGGVDLEDMSKENPQAVLLGLKNLEKHIENITQHYQLPCVVALNHFTPDFDSEIAVVDLRMRAMNIPMRISKHWAEGSKGAIDLAKVVVELAEKSSPNPHYVYEDSLSLWDKATRIAQAIYGAEGIDASKKIRDQIQDLQNRGYGHFPICVAKTQYSFSTDPTRRGAPRGHEIIIREVRLAAGAEFVVLVCGDIMTMPGLPKIPSAHRIDIDQEGRIIGLS